MLRRIEKAAVAALPVDEVELNEIVDAWIAGWQAERGSPEYERNWWAHSQVMDWPWFKEDVAEYLIFTAPVVGSGAVPFSRGLLP